MSALSAPVKPNVGTMTARKKVLAGALLAAAVAAPLTIALVDDFGLSAADISRAGRDASRQVAAAIPGAAKDILAFLTQRSPGERTAAELAKLKGKSRAAPRQRALGKIRQPILPRSVIESLTKEAPLLVVPPVVEALPIVAPKEEALALPATLAAIAPVGPLIGGLPVVGGPGGGGTPVEPPVISPPIVNPPISSPVPEPGTWLTMLVGFGFVGWRVRRTPTPKLNLRSA